MATTVARCSRSTSSASGTGPVNRTASRSASRSSAASAGPPGRAVPTTVSRTGRSVRSLASASSRWTRPLSGDVGAGDDQDRVGVAAAGRPAAGVNSSGSMPTGMTSIAVGGRGPCGWRCRAGEFSDTVVTRVEPARPPGPACAVKRVPAAQRQPPAQRRARRPAPARRSMAIGWWTVATVGQPGAGQAQQPAAEGLVVVDDVELGGPGEQVPGGAQAEGQRLGEPGGAHGRPLGDVDPVAELRGPGRAERVGLAVEVQARQPGERHAVVELGVGLAAEHLDPVPELGQLPGQRPDVDALAAAVRLAPVGQQCDAQRPSHAPDSNEPVPRSRLPAGNRARGPGRAPGRVPPMIRHVVVFTWSDGRRRGAPGAPRRRRCGGCARTSAG